MKLELGPRFGGHAYLLQRPAFSPDSQRIASGCLKGWLIVRTREGKELARLRVPPAGKFSEPQVKGLAWSPDGSCLAVDEYGGVVLRRPDDLAPLAEAKHVGSGPLAFLDRGAHLAVLTSSMGAYVFSAPALGEKFLHLVLGGGLDSFSTDTLAADPHGTLVAVGDDGGSSETAMGATTARGTPKVTLFHGAKPGEVGTVERGQHSHTLVVDPWRKRLFTCTFGDIGVWSLDGQPLRRFQPYAGTHARTLAVCERFVATSPNLTPSLDLWEPQTLEPLASLALAKISAEWIAPSPDGTLVLVPTVPEQRDFGYRVVHVLD